MELIVIKYKHYKAALNPRFLNANNAADSVDLIKQLYKNKFKLYVSMEKESDQAKLQKLAGKVWANEKEIQKAFNFQPNENFFRFWEMPKCSCPVLDNQDTWGTSIHYYSATCVLHKDKPLE